MSVTARAEESSAAASKRWSWNDGGKSKMTGDGRAGREMCADINGSSSSGTTGVILQVKMSQSTLTTKV